ncbi:glycerol-3-phosphate dehydrogenase [Polycladidibacter stylochi]|uniref:glycerol-3-phosphate dehydrogenase n=1 Tax=Polycladidibacter stylochi TaxID=1807766 RepID=UPI000830DABC|nr:glycerol-3-phosphate dehydrogenase [Pseudovibrio stylochi]
MSQVFDLFIIGGGVNGCGIARDAAGRGASVYLAEKNDFASATSSASTKLIHGGLRYLEYYAFRLVREALIEREVLLNAAPHIAWPLRFILPHHKELRPAWLIRLGLFLYDHLGGRKLLAATSSVKLNEGPYAQGLQELFTHGFEYSDCWVDDARLVVLNARDAASKGAQLQRNCEVVAAQRVSGLWHIKVRHNLTGVEETIQARGLVNAAGPWVAQLLQSTLKGNSKGKVRLVQGSHIIVPKLYEHDRCFIFQQGDGRIVFAIPYEHNFTLIGTTDNDFNDDLDKIQISQDEIVYLCNAVSGYFKKTVAPADVVHSYSGVRPLYDDGASEAKSATRDYVLELEGASGDAPLLNIFGGKITTYRRLAESALGKLSPLLPKGHKPWTAQAALPGGAFAPQDFDIKLKELEANYPFLTPTLAKRLLRAYGLDAYQLLGKAKTIHDLGTHFGSELYECEVRWMQTKEWAQTLEDVLWRRSKLGLHISACDQTRLKDYLEQQGEPKNN